MIRKVLAALIVGLLLVAGFGCAKKENTAQNTQPSTQTQLPPGHPGTDGTTGGGQPAKPADVKSVADNVTKDLDAKYPGDWSASGSTLKKGSYTENGNFKIADEVAALYPGSMVSIFVGQDRISGTIKDQTGNRVLTGYPTPDTVGKVMQSGEAVVEAAGSMGSTSYQKVYLPLKANDKTVAVMTISIAQ